GDREHFDLKRYLQGRLARLGVGIVEAVADDTLSEPDLYFSYRRGRKAGDTDYGRNASAIVLVG
ncbi:MAG: laccase domain-containing protein, partial [Pseudomonadota bacterium]